MLNFIMIVLVLALAQKSTVAERGHTIWIGPCGYSYYMTETDDGLPAMMGNTRTYEEAKAIIDSQKARDEELRRQLRRVR